HVAQPFRAASRFFLSSVGFEVTIDLFLVPRGRVVVGAGGQAILDLLFLDLLRQRRFDIVERLRGLPPHLLPLREVLLERLGAGCGNAAAGRRLEGEAAAAAARQARIVAAHLVDEVLGLLELPRVLLAQPLQIAAGAGAGARGLALSALARLARLAGLARA